MRMKIMNMIKKGHRYSKDVYVMITKIDILQHCIMFACMFEEYESLRFKKLQICNLVDE